MNAAPGHESGGVERVLEFLDGVERRTSGTVALCPAHDDHNPSLSIDKGDDGQALLHCFAGCDQGEVLEALEQRGLKRAELFPPRAGVIPLNGRSKGATKPRKGLGDLVRSDTIKDADGRIVAIHDRFQNGKNKSCLWKHPNGGYSKNGEIRPETLPFYGAELVKDWPAEYGIAVVEGEPAADALKAVNFRAVGTVTGAKGTPSPETLELLRGKRVILWPDGDPEGREHMLRLGRRLQGIAASVQWFEWKNPPEGIKGPDAADHPAVKNKDKDALKVLAREIREAPGLPEDAPRDGRILLGRAIERGIEPPEELVPDLLLAGKVHTIYSAASTGKTFVMLWLVLRVIERGLRVLIFDKENGPRIMAERLEQLGGDPARIDELIHYHFYPELPTTEEGLLDYQNQLDEVKPALVVFDSWINFLASNGLDENSSNDVSTWAAHYAHPARSRDIAVLLLDHIPKEGNGSRGSSRKRDEVDVSWSLRNPQTFDRERIGRIVLQREKDREGWLPESVGFSVGGSMSGFVFSRSAGTVEVEDKDGLTPSEHKLLEALEPFGEKGAKSSEWEREALALKVPRTTFHRARRGLLQKQLVSLKDKRYSIKGATGAKEVPRHQVALAPEEVPLVPPPLRVAPSGTGATPEAADEWEEVE